MPSARMLKVERPGSLWRCKSSHRLHKLLEVSGGDTSDCPERVVITWSIESSPMGQGETFLGPLEQFYDEFERVK